MTSSDSSAEFIQTESGSQNIVVAGKCLIESNVMLRGDLRRAGAGQAVAIAIGKHCILRQDCLVRPPYKTFKGAFSYYPVKIGDNVHIGRNCIVQAAAIGSNVRIGDNCIIGAFTIIKDYVCIESGSVVPPNAVLIPYGVYAGSPVELVQELRPEICDKEFAVSS